MSQVEDEAAGCLNFTGVTICRYLIIGLTPAGDTLEKTAGLEPTLPDGEIDRVVRVQADYTCKPLTALKSTQLEGDTANSGEDELAGETTVRVQAEDACKPLTALRLTH